MSFFPKFGINSFPFINIIPPTKTRQTSKPEAATSSAEPRKTRKPKPATSSSWVTRQTSKPEPVTSSPWFTRQTSKPELAISSSWYTRATSKPEHATSKSKTRRTSKPADGTSSPKARQTSKQEPGTSTSKRRTSKPEPALRNFARNIQELRSDTAIVNVSCAKPSFKSKLTSPFLMRSNKKKNPEDDRLCDSNVYQRSWGLNHSQLVEHVKSEESAKTNFESTLHDVRNYTLPSSSEPVSVERNGNVGPIYKRKVPETSVSGMVPQTPVSGISYLSTDCSLPVHPSYLTGLTSNKFAGRVVLSEKIVERKVKMPMKFVIEEYVERLVSIPERRIREEYREGTHIARHKIIEVEKRIINEKIIEVPEYEYVENIVEVPETVVRERICEVPVVEFQERIIEIPKIAQRERIIEVPEIVYEEVPVERIQEVIETREQVVLKEVPVAQYVDKPCQQYFDVKQTIEVARNIPIPLESILTVHFKLPQIRPRWKSVSIPVYVPRFVEIPIQNDVFSDDGFRKGVYNTLTSTLMSNKPFEQLSELEALSILLKDLDFSKILGEQDFIENISKCVKQGKLTIE